MQNPSPSPPVFSFTPPPPSLPGLHHLAAAVWDSCEAALLVCLPLSYLLFMPSTVLSHVHLPRSSLFTPVVTPPAKLHRRLLLLISGISLAVSPSAPLSCPGCAVQPRFSLSPSHLSLSLSHHSRCRRPPPLRRCLGVFLDAHFLLPLSSSPPYLFMFHFADSMLGVVYNYSKS